MSYHGNVLYPTVCDHMEEELQRYHNGPIDPDGFHNYVDWAWDNNDGFTNLYDFASYMGVYYDGRNAVVDRVYSEVRNELHLDVKQADALLFGRVKSNNPSDLYLDFERIAAQVSGKTEDEVRRDYERYLRRMACLYRKEHEYSVYAIYDFVDTCYYMYDELWEFAIKNIEEGSPR